MSADLAVLQPDTGVSLAEAMGVTMSSTKASTLARITQVHVPIKGVLELAGKKITTDVVPQGMYKIEMGDDVAYSNSPTIQIYAQREQWTRWDTENDTMNKTVMETSLNNDLKDTKGGFNLGRGNKFYAKKEWDALDKSTQEKIKEVKRTKIVLGVVTATDLIDEAGEASDMVVNELPFVLDVKNRKSLASLTNCTKKIMSKNVLPIEYLISLKAEIHDLPGGGTYSSTIYNPTQKLEIDPDSSKEILANFLDWVKNSNRYILDLWQEAQSTSLSEEDAEVVANLVNVSAEDRENFG